MMSKAQILTGGALLIFAASAFGSDLSFDERVYYKEKIERAYYDHRIGNKPPFEKICTREALERQVLKYLAQDELLKNFGVPVTDEDLQKELERICVATKAPHILKDIFKALDENAYLVKETLVRPILTERFLRKEADEKLNLRGAEYEAWLNEQIANYELQNANLKSAETTLNFRAFNLPFEPLPPITPQQLMDCVEEWTYVEYIAASANPSRREGHTAVWTGTEMIIWGGTDKSTTPITYFNTGARYNPVADDWQPLPSAGAPAGRAYHAAVWTGTEMIVWGGYNGNYLNTGGHYVPGGGWTSTAVTGSLPVGRAYHTAVWTGALMIVWGGDSGADYLNSGACYNPSTPTWTQATSEGPVKRKNHAAVWTGTQMIIWGGSARCSTGANDFYLRDGSRYNPGSNTWDSPATTGLNGLAANTPTYREKHTAIWAGPPVNRMIIWGGRGGSASNCPNVTTANPLPSGGRYNPAGPHPGSSWAVTATGGVSPSARYSHTAIWTGTHMIIWGGWNGADYRNDGARYIPNSWTAMSNTDAPTGRYGHTAVWSGADMLIWGGYTPAGLTDDGGIYNFTNDEWSGNTMTTPSLNPASRYSHSAVFTGDKMLVWGGRGSGPYLNTGEIHDLATLAWQNMLTTGAPSARIGQTAVWASEVNEMIIWGGTDFSGNYLNTGARFNPTAETWTDTTLTDVPDGRSGHSAVWAPESGANDGEMIIWGGRHSGGYFSMGGRYDPIADSWTATQTIGAPSARRTHSAVWTGDRMIVWGGYDGGYANTGGEYNPLLNSWTATSTTNPPTGREFHTAVWAPEIGEMIIWGGSNVGGYLANGGRYAPGAGWSSVASTAGEPSARYNHSAVWTGSAMVVWGGYNGSYLRTGGRYYPSDDAWASTRLSGAPSARQRHTAVWTGATGDPANTMIVWGGESGGFPIGNGYTYFIFSDEIPVPDIDESGCVDGLDLAYIGRSFGSRCGEAKYYALADLSEEVGFIDGMDLSRLISEFGSGCD